MKFANIHRADIQVLRGIGVLTVLLFHAWPQALPGGFVGVDVFFVISGFLITGLLVEEMQARGRIGLAAFYARRARRLLPAACVVLLACAVAFALTRPAFEMRALVPSFVSAALYASNIKFAWQSVDYLADAQHADPLLHTWSLGVEEQFYLLWPLALLALAHRASPRRAVAALVAVVGVLSLCAAIVLTVAVPSWAFFGLPTRAWEFCAGAAAWLVRPRVLGAHPGVRALLVGGGLSCILISAIFYTARMPFPGIPALLPVLGAALVVAAGGDDIPRWAGGLLRLPALRALGDISYSLYLWHWPVLILLADVWPNGSRWTVGGAGMLLAIGLAMATFRWVENPVRFHSGLHARTRVSLVGACAAMLVTAAAAATAPWLSPAGKDLVSRRKAEMAIRDRPQLYEDRCFAPALQASPPDCIYGPGTGQPTVVLFGDSHAAQWFPALEALAHAEGFRVAVFVKAACPVAIIEPFDPQLGRAYIECTRWRTQALASMAQLRPALIVASTASGYETMLTQRETELTAWQVGLDASLSQLASVSRHVLLLRDTPRPASHVPRCLAREAAAGRDPQLGCSFSRESPSGQRAFAMEQQAVAKLARLSLVDLNRSICPQDPCPILQDGRVVFHDAEHLSASFARTMAPQIWQGIPAQIQAAIAARP